MHPPATNLHLSIVLSLGDKEALAIVQRKLGVDVLIFGHSHVFSAYEHENKFFVNPGSATGAYSGLTLYSPRFRALFILDCLRLCVL